MKSVEIQQEIDRTQERLKEVREMAEASRQELHTRQGGFIDGSTPVEVVQSEQGKLDTLQSSIKSLETRLPEMHMALSAAEKAEALHASAKTLKYLAGQAETIFEKYDAERVKFGEVVTPAITELFASSCSYVETRQAFKAEYSKIAAKEDEDAIKAELARIGLSGESLSFLRSNEMPKVTPAGKFNDAIATGEQIAGVEKYNADREREKKEYNARRAERASAFN